MMQTLIKCINECNHEWYCNGSATVSTVLWIITAIVLARYTALRINEKKQNATSAIIARDLALQIRRMSSFDGANDWFDDVLHLRKVVKNLILSMIKISNGCDKKLLFSLVEKYGFQMVDFLFAIEDELQSSKVTPRITDFCILWIKDMPIIDAIYTTKLILDKCVNSNSWNRILVQMVENRPQIGMVLLGDIENLCETRRTDPIYRKLILECMRATLSTMSCVDESIANRLQCGALNDTDSNLRAMNWKVIGLVMSKLSENMIKILLTAAGGTLLKDPSKLVGAAALKFVASYVRSQNKIQLNRQLSTVSTIRYNMILFIGIAAYATSYEQPNWFISFPVCCHDR